MNVERIKSYQTSAGFVVICMDDGEPTVATHELFYTEDAAVAYAEKCTRPVRVVQLRAKEQSISLTVPNYCQLCRKFEFEKYGTLVSDDHDLHTQACAEAGCSHPAYYY